MWLLPGSRKPGAIQKLFRSFGQIIVRRGNFSKRFPANTPLSGRTKHGAVTAIDAAFILQGGVYRSAGRTLKNGLCRIFRHPLLFLMAAAYAFDGRYYLNDVFHSNCLQK